MEQSRRKLGTTSSLIIASFVALSFSAPPAHADGRIGNEIPLGWVHTDHLACSNDEPERQTCILRPAHGYSEFIRDVPDGKPIRQLAAGQTNLKILSQVQGWSFVAWRHGGGCEVRDNIISDCDTSRPECGAEPLRLTCE
jgi:hypothetical protein